MSDATLSGPAREDLAAELQVCPQLPAAGHHPPRRPHGRRHEARHLRRPAKKISNGGGYRRA
jgi:hypothetical protein